MIVYWYLAPKPPGEEKLSDVSTQQLHIKNSHLLDTGSFVITDARSKSTMLEAPMLFAPRMKGDSIAATGPIQCAHGWDRTVGVCFACGHVYEHARVYACGGCV